MYVLYKVRFTKNLGNCYTRYKRKGRGNDLTFAAPQIDVYNDYYFEIEENDSEAFQGVINALFNAERNLYTGVRVEPPIVWEVIDGQPINGSVYCLPMFAYFDRKFLQDAKFNDTMRSSHWEKFIDNSIVEKFDTPQPQYGVTSAIGPFIVPSKYVNRNYNYPFIALCVHFGTLYGRPKKVYYKGALMPEDWYMNGKAEMKLTPKGELGKIAWPYYIYFMQKALPFLVNCQVDEEGNITRGAPFVGTIHPAHATYFKAQEKEYVKKRLSFPLAGGSCWYRCISEVVNVYKRAHSDAQLWAGNDGYSGLWISGWKRQMGDLLARIYILFKAVMFDVPLGSYVQSRVSAMTDPTNPSYWVEYRRYIVEGDLEEFRLTFTYLLDLFNTIVQQSTDSALFETYRNNRVESEYHFPDGEYRGYGYINENQNLWAIRADAVVVWTKANINNMYENMQNMIGVFSYLDYQMKPIEVGQTDVRLAVHLTVSKRDLEGVSRVNADWHKRSLGNKQRPVESINHTNFAANSKSFRDSDTGFIHPDRENMYFCYGTYWARRNQDDTFWRWWFDTRNIPIPPPPPPPPNPENKRIVWDNTIHPLTAREQWEEDQELYREQYNNVDDIGRVFYYAGKTILKFEGITLPPYEMTKKLVGGNPQDITKEEWLKFGAALVVPKGTFIPPGTLG